MDLIFTSPTIVCLLWLVTCPVRPTDNREVIHRIVENEAVPRNHDTRSEAQTDSDRSGDHQTVRVGDGNVGRPMVLFDLDPGQDESTSCLDAEQVGRTAEVCKSLGVVCEYHRSSPIVLLFFRVISSEVELLRAPVQRQGHRAECLDRMQAVH